MNGNQLKISIKKKGLTQQKAAEILGVSRQTFNSWCKSMSLTEDVIRNVKTLLGVDLRADEVEMLESKAEMTEVAEPGTVPENVFTGLTQEEVDKELKNGIRDVIMGMYESGEAYPAAIVRQYQDQIKELTGLVARLEYQLQELGLKQTAGTGNLGRKEDRERTDESGK